MSEIFRPIIPVGSELRTEDQPSPVRPSTGEILPKLLENEDIQDSTVLTFTALITQPGATQIGSIVTRSLAFMRDNRRPYSIGEPQIVQAYGHDEASQFITTQEPGIRGVVDEGALRAEVAKIFARMDKDVEIDSLQLDIEEHHQRAAFEEIRKRFTEEEATSQIRAALTQISLILSKPSAANAQRSNSSISGITDNEVKKAMVDSITAESAARTAALNAAQRSEALLMTQQLEQYVEKLNYYTDIKRWIDPSCNTLVHKKVILSGNASDEIRWPKVEDSDVLPKKIENLTISLKAEIMAGGLQIRRQEEGGAIMRGAVAEAWKTREFSPGEVIPGKERQFINAITRLQELQKKGIKPNSLSAAQRIELTELEKQLFDSIVPLTPEIRGSGNTSGMRQVKERTYALVHNALNQSTDRESVNVICTEELAETWRIGLVTSEVLKEYGVALRLKGYATPPISLLATKVGTWLEAGHYTKSLFQGIFDNDLYTELQTHYNPEPAKKSTKYKKLSRKQLRNKLNEDLREHCGFTVDYLPIFDRYTITITDELMKNVAIVETSKPEEQLYSPDQARNKIQSLLEKNPGIRTIIAPNIHLANDRAANFQPKAEQIGAILDANPQESSMTLTKNYLDSRRNRYFLGGTPTKAALRELIWTTKESDDWQILAKSDTNRKIRVFKHSYVSPEATNIGLSTLALSLSALEKPSDRDRGTYTASETFGRNIPNVSQVGAPKIGSTALATSPMNNRLLGENEAVFRVHFIDKEGSHKDGTIVRDSIRPIEPAAPAGTDPDPDLPPDLQYVNRPKPEGIPRLFKTTLTEPGVAFTQELINSPLDNELEMYINQLKELIKIQDDNDFDAKMSAKEEEISQQVSDETWRQLSELYLRHITNHPEPNNLDRVTAEITLALLIALGASDRLVDHELHYFRERGWRLPRCTKTVRREQGSTQPLKEEEPSFTSPEDKVYRLAMRHLEEVKNVARVGDEGRFPPANIRSMELSAIMKLGVQARSYATVAGRLQRDIDYVYRRWAEAIKKNDQKAAHWYSRQLFAIAEKRVLSMTIHFEQPAIYTTGNENKGESTAAATTANGSHEPLFDNSSGKASDYIYPLRLYIRKKHDSQTPNIHRRPGTVPEAAIDPLNDNPDNELITSAIGIDAEELSDLEFYNRLRELGVNSTMRFNSLARKARTNWLYEVKTGYRPTRPARKLLDTIEQIDESLTMIAENHRHRRAELKLEHIKSQLETIRGAINAYPLPADIDTTSREMYGMQANEIAEGNLEAYTIKATEDLRSLLQELRLNQFDDELISNLNRLDDEILQARKVLTSRGAVEKISSEEELNDSRDKYFKHLADYFENALINRLLGEQLLRRDHKQDARELVERTLTLYLEMHMTEYLQLSHEIADDIFPNDVGYLQRTLQGRGGARTRGWADRIWRRFSNASGRQNPKAELSLDDLASNFKEKNFRLVLDQMLNLVALAIINADREGNVPEHISSQVAKVQRMADENRSFPYTQETLKLSGIVEALCRAIFPKFIADDTADNLDRIYRFGLPGGSIGRPPIESAINMRTANYEKRIGLQEPKDLFPADHADNLATIEESITPPPAVTGREQVQTELMQQILDLVIKNGTGAPAKDNKKLKMSDLYPYMATEIVRLSGYDRLASARGRRK